jgi:hypothetical protein
MEQHRLAVGPDRTHRTHGGRTRRRPACRADGPAAADPPRGLARAQPGAESAVALIGFSFLQFAVHLPMVLFLLWLLGLSLTYHPPVMPAPT